MKDDDTIPKLALFGGPLQRLGCRLGLVRGDNTFGLGVALGLLAWGVLVSLALLQGVGHKVFSLAMLGVHVRFLVSIPLFFLCETWVGPRMAEFARDIARFGIVPESGHPAFGAAIRRIDRLKDPWPAEILFLMAVAVFVLIEPATNLPGTTGNWKLLMAETGGRTGPVLGWYLWFCLPLFRFLLLRWLWHLGLWCYFLWRVQKLDLHLVPTHPDHEAGLGYLEVVQGHFATLVVAMSAVVAASSAEGLASGTMEFETLYRLIPAILLVAVLLFVGPLLMFSPKLWVCRISGWSDYMGMASRYINAFDRKWIRGENPSAQPLLGTADMQSLADLTNSVNVVRNMQWIPVSRRLVVSLGVSALVPIAPLLFFRYPVSDVAAKLFQTITGL